MKDRKNLLKLFKKNTGGKTNHVPKSEPSEIQVTGFQTSRISKTNLMGGGYVY